MLKEVVCILFSVGARGVKFEKWFSACSARSAPGGTLILKVVFYLIRSVGAKGVTFERGCLHSLLGRRQGL